ncbi:chorismate synthase [Actinopolyspora erythraea]|uniref:Chorismate synthase n=1 Tax=Actinopolyspora erythraea TaxID=414996 RepID=A0A099D5B2_9ACTN|nr:chorismate synthase [Actinopolyspora erythraea]ASU79395.1 chorismate synthase [Actinopolyspora erythraea]KGI80992.1 chorismate synthase [Actinopolyspora erythraea]
MLRWMTAGESHGPALVGVLEGMVAGVEVTTEDINAQLERRKLGFGRSPRMNFESDELEVIGGIRHGLTQGGPVAVRIGNTEWPKWQQVMAADPVDPEVLSSLARNEPLTRPRPGHADLPGMQKYDFDESRPVLERASARETAARVAVGTVARHFLRQLLGVELVSHVVSLGDVDATQDALPTAADLPTIDENPVRAFGEEATERMMAEVESAKSEGDTLGGVVEVVVHGLPPGIGSHVHWDRKLDSRLAQALMSIQAVKGVEIGDAFANARRRGSAAHDELYPAAGPNWVHRGSNRAGGLEGGITNGEPLVVRAAKKPISSLPRALSTIDVRTGEQAQAMHQRSDITAVPRAAVVAETMVALVLAQAVLEKFGGDSLGETRRNVRGYLTALTERAEAREERP